MNKEKFFLQYSFFYIILPSRSYRKFEISVFASFEMIKDKKKIMNDNKRIIGWALVLFYKLNRKYP